MPIEMSFKDHIYELRSRILRIAISILAITIFCMTFGIEKIDLNYENSEIIIIDTIFYPYPNPLDNIAIQITGYMKENLVPTGVELIQTAPGQAFFAQVYVAILIGMIITIPIIVKETYEFVFPAIEKDKRKKKIKLIKMLFPIILLFITGLVFAYVLVIPFTLDILYKYGESLGVETFLNINDFISFVLQFLLGFGVAFQLPIIMYVISLSEIVDKNFWIRNFRYAIIILVVFGAIITPDGSGVTMWFITGPMTLLYLSGILLIKMKTKDVVIK
ncbi:MAG: twin-arginine translocase subunit TatC [Nitrososphaeraceae archaeon]